MSFSLIPWLEELSTKLTAAFGEQLLFLGLQGSYGRGEATPDSDIDLVVILEEAGIPQLDTYHAVLQSMSNREKVCGFVCGRTELAAWPGFDLIGLYLDTRPILGCLSSLMPPLDHGHLVQAVRIGASVLFHGACHSYLHNRDDLSLLQGLYKNAFFLLRLYHHALGNPYCSAGRELLPALAEEDREILSLCLNRASFQPDQTCTLYAKLIPWSRRMLCAPLP